MNFLKRIFHKKTADEKLAARELRTKKGETLVSCKEWCETVASDPTWENFLRYCQKVILVPEITEKTKATNSFWSVFYAKWGEGEEPFNEDEYWETRLSPFLESKGVSDTRAYNIKYSFLDFCEKEELPTKGGLFYTVEAKWDFFWQEFCKKYFPVLVPEQKISLKTFVESEKISPEDARNFRADKLKDLNEEHEYAEWLEMYKLWKDSIEEAIEKGKAKKKNNKKK